MQIASIQKTLKGLHFGIIKSYRNVKGNNTMTLLKTILIISLFWASSGYADIYKCVVNGKTTFAQQPCAANAVKVEVNTHQPSDEERQRAQESAEFNQSYNAENKLKYKILTLNRKNSDLKRNIEDYQSKMDSEIEDLKRDKSRSANNLAGATWEKSLSEEMSAVTSKYQVKIEQANREISRNDDKISRLEAE